MPELPEVETIARCLCARVVGQTIAEVQVKWPRSIATPDAGTFASALVGRAILDVSRRAKFIVLTLSGGRFLIVHLRMTGQLLVDEAATPAPSEVAADARWSQDAHSHVRLLFASGLALRLHDQRKFGRFYLVDDLCTVLGHLGREPLAADFSVKALGAILRRHRRQIKPLLFDQRLVAGMGNIYIDESLWEARLHPLRRAHTLSLDDATRLHAAMRGVLARAIAHNGTTLRDYLDPDERPGEHQDFLVVYGRRGAPCPRCGQAIARTVVGQRGTYYCPACQTLPPEGEPVAAPCASA